VFTNVRSYILFRIQLVYDCLKGTGDAADGQGDGEEGSTPEDLSPEFEQLWAGAGHACCLQVPYAGREKSFSSRVFRDITFAETLNFSFDKKDCNHDLFRIFVIQYLKCNFLKSTVFN
jgi:hypothetical protein